MENYPMTNDRLNSCMDLDLRFKGKIQTIPVGSYTPAVEEFTAQRQRRGIKGAKSVLNYFYKFTI